jgi:hypothetical protein
MGRHFPRPSEHLQVEFLKAGFWQYFHIFEILLASTVLSKTCNDAKCVKKFFPALFESVNEGPGQEKSQHFVLPVRMFTRGNFFSSLKKCTFFRLAKHKYSKGQAKCPNSSFGTV